MDLEKNRSKSSPSRCPDNDPWRKPEEESGRGLDPVFEAGCIHNSLR